MYISLDWISDYVDLYGLDPQEIANKLTLATAEVEDVKRIERFVDGVLVGKVIAAESLPSSEGKKLTFCTVDCGGKTYTTVCGASNARVGLIAPFAPVGCSLAKGVKIEKSTVNGKPSEGILCSAAELGMSDWHEIVFECPADTRIGASFSEYVPAFDTLIEVDNKSVTHRPDLWGHYGFARELAAVYGRPLKPLPKHDLAQYDALPEYALQVDDLENCPAYGCIEMEFGPNANNTVPSPIIMQRRLHALGQRTYNLFVDVTNYVNQELGQPTHAFDGNLVPGIRVMQSGTKRTFKTLDGQDRAILPEDLLICNSKSEAIAIAGIMGGQETEVSAATQKILLESANFKSGRIRRTSTRLGLRTDASQRYEKSQPPFNVQVGAERIVHLLCEAGLTPKMLSRWTVRGDLAKEFRPIKLIPGQLERLAGIELPREKILSILTSLGFTAEYATDGTLSVGVPPFRSKKDISIPEDIVEEVLRIYGFDNIPPQLPVAPISPLFVEKELRLEHKTRKILAASHRFVEVHNYCWTNDQWTAKLGFDPGETLVLKNPAVQAESRLRTTLLPNLFALIPKNRPIRDRFRFFEFGHIYLPAKDDEVPMASYLVNDPQKGDFNTGCVEVSRLAGVSFQQSGSTLEEHYLSIKSAIEDLGVVLQNQDFRFVAPENSNPNVPWESAGEYVEIYQTGGWAPRLPEGGGCGRDAHAPRCVGKLGVVGKSLLEKISPEGGQIVWFEIAFDQISGELFPKIRYTELPKFPGSWQDFSLVWDIDKGFAALEKVLNGFTHPLINRREFVVAYKGKGLEKGTASYSFRYWIGSDDHTLTGPEIDAFHQTFLDFIQEHGISLRG